MNGDKPLVSVIMNCFNSATYLREAIDSVYAQTYQNWEIIFWDNVSTDQSAEIAKSYDSRLRYFRGQKTIPLGAARNEAVKQAQGEYIAFLDCDDIWFADKLAKQVSAMSVNDYAVCYSGIIQINKKGQKLGVYHPTYKSGFIFEDLLNQFDINLPTIMVRTSALMKSGLEFDKNVSASEEYCLFMQLAVDYPFCVLSECLAKYRLHEKALTNASIAKWAEEREYTLDLIKKSHLGIEGKYKDAFSEAYARANYYRARYFVVKDEKLKALSALRKALWVNPRYFFLFCLLLMPLPVWNFVHRVRSKRSEYSANLG